MPLTADAGGIAEAINPRTGESFATEAWHTMSPAARARHNERELQPLRYPATADGPKTGGVAEATEAASVGKLDPFYQQQKAMREAGAAGVAPESARRDAVMMPGAPSAPIRRVKRASGVPRPPVPEEGLSDATSDPGGMLSPSAGLAPPPTDAPGASVNRAPDRSGEVDRPPAVGQAPGPDPYAPIDLSTMPAASNTDSPTRGIVRPNISNARPNRPEITGGFGDQAALQYFALDGRELLTLVETLMDEVHARLQNDLRFNEALTYPQVSARVVIEISGFAHDSDFLIDKILPTTHEARTRTPIEIARSVADEVAFVVMAERREADDEGNPIAPPDQLRQELGLRRPGKRMIRSPLGTESFVDV